MTPSSLPDHLAGRGVVDERAGAVGRHQVNATLPEELPAGLLHHDVAGEAVGGLDQDDAHAVALDPLQHGGEARPRVRGVGARDRRVMELLDDREAGRLEFLGQLIQLSPDAKPTWVSVS